jgi:hypothetical protein
MPDTRENQAAYPQVYNQKPGLGFPIARLGAVISLACGAVVNLGFCQYAGKGQGEVSLPRRLWDVLRPGDILLADRLTANWANIVLFRERHYRLVPARLGPVRDWIAHYERFWDDHLQRLQMHRKKGNEK